MSGERQVALVLAPPSALAACGDDAGGAAGDRADAGALGGGIPPGTPVQKRNPFKRPAVFLSWFLVDPDRPFAPKARFP